MFTKALEKPARKSIPRRTQQYALLSSRNSSQKDREEFTASVPHTWPSSTKATLQTGGWGAPASTCHASAFPSLLGKLRPVLDLQPEMHSSSSPDPDFQLFPGFEAHGVVQSKGLPVETPASKPEKLAQIPAPPSAETQPR